MAALKEEVGTLRSSLEATKEDVFTSSDITQLIRTELLDQMGAMKAEWVVRNEEIGEDLRTTDERFNRHRRDINKEVSKVRAGFLLLCLFDS